jgi:hypothetical protein
MAKETPLRILHETRRVDFYYNRRHYTYEYHVSNNGGWGYLFEGHRLIYDGRKIMEGEAVYQAIWAELNAPPDLTA